MTKSEPRLQYIYGAQSCRAVLSRRPEAVTELLLAGEEKGARLELASRAREMKIPVRHFGTRELDQLCRTDSHQGAAVKASLAEYADLEDVIRPGPSTMLALDGITDPHNLGAMIRSAEALGAAAVIIPRDRSAGLSPTVHKTSAGAAEYIPVVQAVNLARALRQLKAAGFWSYGADPRGPTALDEAEFHEKTVLVIGAEDKGIRPGIEKEIDFRVRIPLAGQTRSLNASVACAIMLHKMRRK